MKSSEKNKIKVHDRLFRDIQHHIEGTSFESVSAFVHHVMADIVSTGDLALGGNIPQEEADLVRRRLEALGYIDSSQESPEIPVHGGVKQPVNRLVPPEGIDDFIREAKKLDAYSVSADDLPLLYRFGDGVLSPLDGPMVKEEFDRVLEEEVILRDGVKYAWTIPIGFPIHEEQASSLKEGQRLAVIDDKNDIVGIITVREAFPWDKKKYLKGIYGTDRTDHAGARVVSRDRREWMLGGSVEVLPEQLNPLLSDVILPAWKTRELCRNRRWQKVVALHTDTPLIRSEEYAMVRAAENLTREGNLTGIVLNPYIGEDDPDGLSALTRMKCYRILLEKRLIGKGDKDLDLWRDVGYDIIDQCILLGLNMKKYLAGPKEAVMHAICRQNLGFSHLVVMLNHAGAAFDGGAPLFQEGEAQKKFTELEGELRIQAVPMGRAAYFKELGRVALAEDYKDKKWESLSLSESELWAKVKTGESLDPRLVRPEVARILKADHELYKTSKSTNITWHHASITKEDREALNNHRGIVIWYTGLSASGKSSVARSVEGKLYERGIRTYVLDGDNVRHGLNANLGFSPEDREENIRRIGQVAKLFAEGGVVVMTAFISPYQKDRDVVRELLEPGDFIEVFVDCPVEVCEKRDPKGLYKKARAGQIPEFTGISAPYEAPDNPEIHLDAGKLSIDGCADEVVKYLEENNMISRR